MDEDDELLRSMLDAASDQPRTSRKRKVGTDAPQISADDEPQTASMVEDDDEEVVNLPKMLHTMYIRPAFRENHIEEGGILRSKKATETAQFLPPKPNESDAELSDEDILLKEAKEREDLRQQLARVLPFPSNPVEIIDALKVFTVLHQDEQANERTRRKIRRIEEVECDPYTHETCLGDARVKKLRWYLNNMGFLRSADQINFHEHYLQSILPLLYADDWDKHSVRVMREFGITELKSEVLVMTPRRFGKSYAVAMFVLAAMLVAPVEIAVFSPTGRASGSMMKLVIKFANNIPGAVNRIVGKNHERLYLAAQELAPGIGMNSIIAKNAQSLNSTAKLACFPSSTKGQCMRERTREQKYKAVVVVVVKVSP